MVRKKIVIIGSGFAGLSAAGLLARAGHHVTVLEKNEQPGGRARVWEIDGFRFDMGPSWYWMPDVFEKHFNLFGKTTRDFYELKRLDPGYRIYFPDNDQFDVSASLEKLALLFEQREPGSSNKLKSFLKTAEFKYKTAMEDYVHRISNSIAEYFDLRLLIKGIQLNIFQSLRSEVRKSFRDPALVSLLEFPVLFLGSTPQNTPGMYSMMNYADLVLGTWYPMGGMHKIVEALLSIAKTEGARIELNTTVTKIEVQNDCAQCVFTNNKSYVADVVVAGGDYHHTEQYLLPESHRNYSGDYWNKRTMSPSSLVIYLGINKKLLKLLHHNLFFDSDFEQHAQEIYTNPKWPTAPLFYACVPSVTDDTVAPAAMENLFILMPLAAGLQDTEALREKYFDLIVERIEQRIGTSIRDSIVVKRTYCVNDFERDYNSYKGNAYGLANTLKQTAFMKPKMISPKVRNLFYTGQLTVPGPGVPPAIISGQMVAREISRRIQQNLV